MEEFQLAAALLDPHQIGAGLFGVEQARELRYRLWQEARAGRRVVEGFRQIAHPHQPRLRQIVCFEKHLPLREEG